MLSLSEQSWFRIFSMYTEHSCAYDAGRAVFDLSEDTLYVKK
jgi:hypothetical protein